MSRKSKPESSPVHDAKAMIDQLGIADEARRAGSQDLPASNTIEPDISERTIRAQFDNVRLDLNSEAGAIHDALMAEQPELLARIEGNRIEECPAHIREQVSALDATWHPELEEVNEREKKTRRARHAAEHAAGGGIDINEVSGRFLVIATLLVLILVESIANGLVLGVYADGGYLGGIVQAFAISVLSVGLSWTAGDALRHLFDVSRIGKAFAAIGTVAFGGVLVVYHTVVAWLRMVLQHADRLHIDTGEQVYELSSKPQQAFEWAIPFAIKYGVDPAHLDDIHAWFLLIVGCFFGIGAFVAGWRNKTVRGLVARARLIEAHEAALKSVRDTNSRYLEEYTSLHHEGLTEVDRLVKEAGKALIALRENTSLARRNYSEHQASIAAVERTFLVAIEYFRSTNAIVRTTPIPAYFCEPPMPLADDGFRLDMAGVEAADNLLGNALNAVQAIEQKAQTSRASIRRQLENGLAMTPAYLAGFRSTPAASRVDIFPGSPNKANASIVSYPQLKALR